MLGEVVFADFDFFKHADMPNLSPICGCPLLTIRSLGVILAIPALPPIENEIA
jgi:hypothetical protein